jgi:hypothetical protein
MIIANTDIPIAAGVEYSRTTVQARTMKVRHVPIMIPYASFRRLIPPRYVAGRRAAGTDRHGRRAVRARR